ncbi:MAG: hypothetical protein AB7H96_02015 [Vicinamibacterales bacterium]
MSHMLEVSASTSRGRASVSTVLAAVVAVMTMGFLAGVAPRLCTALARDAAVRTTRSGQRQAQEPHGAEHHGPPGEPAAGSFDAADRQADNATHAPPTPDAALDGPTLPALSGRLLPVTASTVLGIRAGRTTRPGGRAPPLA